MQSSSLLLDVDLWRVLLFSAGLTLFLAARRLARNQIFYYTAGCSTGLLASMAILIFVLYRFVPKVIFLLFTKNISQRSFAVSFLLGGWSFSLYCLYSLYRNLHQYLIEYQKFVAIYVVRSKKS